MFKNILIPTDGSKLSVKSIKSGVAFAKSIKAQITGCHVVEPFQPYYFGDYIPPDMPTAEEFERQARQAGEKYLEQIKTEALAAGLKYHGSVVMADTPYSGIIDAAKKAKCDLIFMASHGRRGLSGILLGSETHKVLTHSKIPVLVYR
ncbi:MAG TPA: universal stress protein [Burkholderiales bacterium]|nr:universal stress protein [Burkholderiales bacterium]